MLTADVRFPIRGHTIIVSHTSLSSILLYWHIVIWTFKEVIKVGFFSLPDLWGTKTDATFYHVPPISSAANSRMDTSGSLTWAALPRSRKVPGNTSGLFACHTRHCNWFCRNGNKGGQWGSYSTTPPPSAVLEQGNVTKHDWCRLCACQMIGERKMAEDRAFLQSVDWFCTLEIRRTPVRQVQHDIWSFHISELNLKITNPFFPLTVYLRLCQVCYWVYICPLGAL